MKASEHAAAAVWSKLAAPSPSKSVQPTIASATAISLSSPYLAQFASNRVPENRDIGRALKCDVDAGGGHAGVAEGSVEVRHRAFAGGAASIPAA